MQKQTSELYQKLQSRRCLAANLKMMINEYLQTHYGILDLLWLPLPPSGCHCEFVSAIAESVTSTISEIQFSVCGNSHSTRTLALLSNLSRLQSMRITNCRFSDEKSEALSSALVRLTELSSLVFSRCQFADSNFMAFGLALSRNPQVQSLRLFDCGLGPELISSLANLVGLTCLELSGCHSIDDSDTCLQALATSLARMKSLAFFSLVEHRNIGFVGWKSLAPVLSSMVSLKTLNLSDTRLKLDVFFTDMYTTRTSSTDDCVTSSSALMMMPGLAAQAGTSTLGGTCACRFDKLESLTLDRNSFKCLALENDSQFTSVLVKMKSLSALSMKEIDVDLPGLQSLGVALRQMPDLTTLYFSKHRIIRTEFVELADTIADMPWLRFLYLGSNNITDSYCEILAPALAYMRSLRILFLPYNRIGPVGCTALATSLPMMVSLESLYLSYNCIGNAGCEALLPAFQIMVWLKHIDLNSNNIHHFKQQHLIQEIGHDRQIWF
jgi:Leucine-rich repeat (LRR) protein